MQLPSVISLPMVAGTFLLFSAESSAAADVVTEWNLALSSFCSSRANRDVPSCVESRIFATTHLAMLEAVTAALASSEDGESAPLALVHAAAAHAAHNVLVAVWPEGKGYFDFHLATSLRPLADAGILRRGAEIGGRAAQLEIEQLSGARGDDSMRSVYSGAIAAPWQGLPPIGLKRPDQFRAGDPGSDDALSASRKFCRSRPVAALMDTAQAAAWPAIVDSWAETPALRWNRAARELAAGDTRDVLEHARLFAALNAALVDAGLAATASRELYSSGRSRLQCNEHMYQIIGGYPCLVKTATPRVPNFPSLAAAESGAAAAVLIRFFGDDTRPFTLAASGLPAGDSATPAPRTFRCIADAAKESAIGGMLAGREFKEACTLGYDLGFRVGQWIGKRHCFAVTRP